jgi:hypothetical protein
MLPLPHMPSWCVQGKFVMRDLRSSKVNIKVVVFWDVTPCSVVYISTNSLDEALEMLVLPYRSTWCHIPEDHTLNHFSFQALTATLSPKTLH